jgi:hypothetical protein
MRRYTSNFGTIFFALNKPTLGRKNYGEFESAIRTVRFHLVRSEKFHQGPRKKSPPEYIIIFKKVIPTKVSKNYGDSESAIRMPGFVLDRSKQFTLCLKKI